MEKLTKLSLHDGTRGRLRTQFAHFLCWSWDLFLTYLGRLIVIIVILREISRFVTLLTNFYGVSLREVNAHQIWWRVNILAIHILLTSLSLLDWTHLNESLQPLSLLKNYSFEHISEFVENAKKDFWVDRELDVGYSDQKNRAWLIVCSEFVILYLASCWWAHQNTLASYFKTKHLLFFKLRILSVGELV